MHQSESEPKSTIVLDIDGTICPIKHANENYADLIPDAEMIEIIRLYRDLGFKIAFYTSRNMKSFNGNPGRINAITAPIVVAWLKKWDIPFDELYFAKPWPGPNGFYVDDRAIRPNEFKKLNPSEISALLTKQEG